LGSKIKNEASLQKTKTKKKAMTDPQRKLAIESTLETQSISEEKSISRPLTPTEVAGFFVFSC